MSSLESFPSSHYPAEHDQDTTLDLAEQTQEHFVETREPFVLKLTQGDRPAFASLIEKLGLAGAIGSIEPLVELRKLQGKQFSDTEEELISRLKDVVNTQHQQGRDLGEMELQFRWTSADSQLGVEDLVEAAYTHGGGAPNPIKPWTHIGDSVVGDFMAGYSSSPGVLFIYDGNKLQGITDEERAANSGYASYYATKPIPGLELKDALVGMISFEESDMQPKEQA